MSYDITWRFKTSKDTWETVPTEYDTHANITWNVKGIIQKSTKLPWKNEEDNGLVIDIIPSIKSGLKELQEHPEEYLALESPNGWGTIEGTIHFFKTILSDWEKFKQYSDMKDYVDKVHFWIV